MQVNAPNRYIWFVIYSFYTFLSDRNIFLRWLVFSNSNVIAVQIPWYSSPSLDWVLNFSLNLGTVLHFEIEKQCFFSFWTIWPLLSFLTFNFVSVVLHYIAIIPFLFRFLRFLNFHFFPSLQMISILRQIKKFFVDLMIRLSHNTIHQPVCYCWAEQQKLRILSSFWLIHLSFSFIWRKLLLLFFVFCSWLSHST